MTNGHAFLGGDVPIEPVSRYPPHCAHQWDEPGTRCLDCPARCKRDGEWRIVEYAADGNLAGAQ